MSAVVAKYSKVQPIYPSVKAIYKGILRQSKLCFDDSVKYTYINTARVEFRKNRNVKNQDSINELTGTAFGHWKTLIRANSGFHNDLNILIGNAYGFHGPLVNKRLRTRSLLQFDPKKVQNMNENPEKSIQWGAALPPQHLNYNVHPRVLLSFQLDVQPFLEEMLRYTSRLEHRFLRDYRIWSELSWLPSASMRGKSNKMSAAPYECDGFHHIAHEYFQDASIKPTPCEDITI